MKPLLGSVVFLCLCLKTLPHASHSPSSNPQIDHQLNYNGTDFLADSASSRFGKGGTSTSSSTWTFSSTAARSRIVETKYGRVQGLSVTLFSNIHYSGNRNFPLKNKIVEIFFSIPYAAPPVKSHRFSPTQTPVPWNDVRATIQPSAVCPQIFPDIRNESQALKEMPKGYLEYLRRLEPHLRNQSEDCLYLNIFSPIGPDAKPKPVLVYIHGGMFAWGSGNLVDATVPAAYADVVFVSINYRLSILGFLNLNDSPSSKPRVANYGLMDQIAALHWIKENIRNFGGDPDNITLMGYEAGAACINFLMASPTVTPGLFHRSILMAGSSHAPWALIQDPFVAGQSVAAALNCSFGGGNNGSSSLGSGHGPGEAGMTLTTTTSSPHHSASSDPVLECLKTKHFSEFTKFSLPKFSVDFGPSVDGIVIKPNFRINNPPPMGKRDTLTNKKYDVLVGLSSLEKLTEFSEMDLEFGFESLRRDALLRTLVRNSYRYHRNEILATITNEYIDWERTAQHPISTRDMAVNAVTDCLALAPVVALTDSPQVKRAFFYVFEHSTKDGLYNYHRAGAGGGEELNYIFGYPLVEFATGGVLPFLPAPLPSNYSKGEVALSELWMSFISNFVHSGNPNGPIKVDSVSSWPVSKERNRYKNTAWDSYDRLHQKYLEIGANKIRTRSHYRAHQMAIWLRLVPELQRSGAQMASTYHNRMRGGNDPVLYTGRLKQPEEEIEESAPELGLGSSTTALNSAMLYDFLLGYGYGDGGPLGGGGGQEGQPFIPSLHEEGHGLSDSELESIVVRNKGKSPTLTMTTCYSPVSSSVQSGGRTGSNESSVSSTNFFDSKNFPPYSVILAITIAVGISLLILNISIFALCYFQRQRRRSKLLKSRSTTSSSGPGLDGVGGCGSSSTRVEYDDEDEKEILQISSSPSAKFSYSQEPSTLLKANRTMVNSFVQNTNSHLQAEMDALEVLELTVKQHHQELMGEKALQQGMGHILHRPSAMPHSYSTHTLPRDYFPQQTSSPSVTSTQSQRSSGSTTTGQSLLITSNPTPLAIATLPRCNGNFTNLGGLSSFISSGGGSSNSSSTSSKPNPPPRGSGTLRPGVRLEHCDNANSDSNNENEGELKV